MEYFFRHTPDPKTNISMGMVWIFLIIYLLFSYKFRYSKKLLEFQFVFIILVELSLIYWYYTGKVIFLKEGLPLYHCRVAAFMMPIAYFTKKYKLASYFSYMAIIGPLVAYSIPDPSKFMWPHITNVTYVCAHTMLIASGLMFIINNREDLDLKYIIKVTLGINLIIYLANYIFDANYGYLRNLPESLGINIHSIVLLLAISLLLVLGIYALNIVARKILRNKLKC